MGPLESLQAAEVVLAVAEALVSVLEQTTARVTLAAAAAPPVGAGARSIPARVIGTAEPLLPSLPATTDSLLLLLPPLLSGVSFKFLALLPPALQASLVVGCVCDLAPRLHTVLCPPFFQCVLWHIVLQ